LANDFTLSAFARFVDGLCFPVDGGHSRTSPVTWRAMSHNGCEVKASCGVRVPADSRLVDPSSFDYLVMVGGSVHRGRQIDDATAAYLVAAAASGVNLVGLCTGGLILCRLGLMRGRTSCVSWHHYQDFVDEFPDAPVVIDRPFLVDGNRITCGCGAGAAQLAAYLIKHMSMGLTN
jgi:transcriptional regulator GlxA family with amidase domain